VFKNTYRSISRIQDRSGFVIIWGVWTVEWSGLFSHKCAR